MQIRSATPADIEGINDIYNQAVAATTARSTPSPGRCAERARALAIMA